MTPPHSERVRLSFVGDVAIGGDFLRRAAPNGSDLTYPFTEIASLFQGTNVLTFNFEGPLGNNGQARRDVRAHIYNEADILTWAKTFPVTVCNLANNHIMDYGAERLIATIDTLDQNGLHHCGAGKTPDTARKPLIIHVGDLTIGFLSFTTNEANVGSIIATDRTPGCASFTDIASTIALVQLTSQRVDILVVSLHWGFEYYYHPTPDQVLIARQIIDAGASLVIGHHPHVMQGVERYKNGIIAYSLGNLILPEFRLPNGRVQYRKPETKHFCVLHVDFAGRTPESWSAQGGRCMPNYRLSSYTASEREVFENRLREISQVLTRQDYPSIYSSLKTSRSKELSKAALWDSLRKLTQTDWRIAAKSLSVGDLRRMFGRAFASLK